MDQDLRVPILPPVKLLIRFWCLVNTDLVRDNKGGFSAARDDHVAQVSVVLLYIALACADCESLILSLAYFFSFPAHSLCLYSLEKEAQLTFSNSFPNEIKSIPFPEFSSGAPGSLGTYSPGNTDTTRWSSDLDTVFQHNRRHFFLSILS